MIQPLFEVSTGGELQPALGQEFLLTNGMGAFSSGTVAGCNTRRYHGLLCAATHPPLGRMIALSRLGEIVYLDGQNERMIELSVNQFESGSFHPRGDRYLTKFELGQTAKWTYEVDGVVIEKEVQLVWGQNLVAVKYMVKPDRERVVRFEVLPFVAMRDFHSLRRGTDFPFRPVSSGSHLKVEAGKYSLHMRANWGQFKDGPDWWRNHKYAVESERGQDDVEDLYTPGRFSVEGTGEMSVTIWAGLSDPGARDWDAELLNNPTTGQLSGSTTMKRLQRAAADFVVVRNRPDGKAGTTILAGYPWFSDWGRDSMISLPGLLLATGRHAQAAQVLSVFAEYVSEGMIPNRFDDYTNEPSYNTVDASLWFIQACYEYLKASGDQKTFEHALLPACKEILRGYREGTRYFIKMDEVDGLISQGDHTTQLTWMDAKMGDRVFTPRQGKAVEINALWYNALRLMGEDALADKVRESFVKAYWISAERGLADVANNEVSQHLESNARTYWRDEAIRPNQIFAVSLPHSPLSREQQVAVVEVVRRELLTPYGLRTLDRNNGGYKAKYTGPQWFRDEAYHNGTVWPWLIGGFLEGYLKANGFSEAAKGQAKAWLTPLIEHMGFAGCIGQIPELFDAEAPQRPVGTPAQAWSVAEVLRVAAMLEM